MYIKSERCIITDLTMDMCADIHKNSLDEDNRRFVPDEVFETLEEAQETVEFLIGAYQSADGPFIYPIITNEDANIGYVQVCRVEEGFEIGYHIAKPYTGNGFATEAIRAFLPVIMSKFEIDKIYGIVLEENIASHKVLERSGFELLYKGIGEYQGNDKEIRRYVYKH